MALPIDVCLPDYSNLKDINKKIIFCCTKMEDHILIESKEGLIFVPIGPFSNIPKIVFQTQNNSVEPEPLSYCPFCGSKIEIRPS